ncbi:SCAN domain-containing protein 3-like [Octopus sinensis]|uniref:SCAN domain-containing protein 3-like n=1 Tax=Octopus sinensis TaxID=2607531 RepID=A0A6P7TUD8_9MOLL|nr:SCAN domain-containing protein 3-like [Octopus sinensis]
MKPSLLSRHQVSNHFETIGKPNDFFKNKKDNIRKIDDSFNFDINFLLSKLSYMISYRIAKAKKPHTIAENLIIPCIKDMFECFPGNKLEHIVRKIPCSNDTVNRRIRDLSENIKEQVIFWLIILGHY